MQTPLHIVHQAWAAVTSRMQAGWTRLAAISVLAAGAALGGCRGEPGTDPDAGDPDTVDVLGPIVPPTPLALEKTPAEFWPAPESEENPLTVEGAALGESLFHDPILSLDSSLSCATCHRPEDAFSQRGVAVSAGFQGRAGTRNAPALFNQAWFPLLFWDGRSPNLEEQALHPVRDEREMALPWDEAARRLRAHRGYRAAFRKAFGEAPIDSQLVARALAQYVRTLVSVGSRFDRWKAGEAELTEEELLGYEVFNSEKTDCFHCHREPFFTLFSFHNIGLDSLVEGTGMGGHTGIGGDMGKWKVPSLRNLGFTAPYMHDGRLATLEDVLDFYESGGHMSENLDNLIRNPDNPSAKLPGQKGLGLTETERKAMLAFLRTLDESAFVARHSRSR